MKIELDSKVAIVTGSASGIGRECASALARAGASVMVADIDIDGAQKVAKDIADEGGRAAAVHLDLADAASIASMIEATIQRFGRLDILHNNAAATQLAATRDFNVDDTDPEVWAKTMQINLMGTVIATKHALPHLIKSGEGSIVNTSSGASLAGDLGHTAYAVSKGAINTLTQYTAVQYGKDGVRCNAIAPGLTVTPTTAVDYAGPMGEMMLGHHLTPNLGAPIDIASMVVFLASPVSRFVTGQILRVDGGLLSQQPYVADVRAARATN